MVSDRLLFSIAVIAGTLLGPLIFTVWIRNHEEHAPEPWTSVARSFLWGASGAVVLALILELVFAPGDALTPLGVSGALASAVIVAPIVEEGTKALGLRWIDDDHVELEDGLIYGAAAGLGFSATENIVYGVSAWMDGGLSGLVVTVGVRTFTSSLLHATATAILGLAVWGRRANDTTTLGLAAAYVGAVALHAVFNAFASIQLFGSFVAILAISFFGLGWIRSRVQELDARA